MEPSNDIPHHRSEHSCNRLQCSTIPSKDVKSRTAKWKKDNNPDEPETDSGNVQLNIEQQSYGEQSITEGSDNLMKNRDQEIIKGRETLEQTESMMEESSKES